MQKSNFCLLRHSGNAHNAVPPYTVKLLPHVSSHFSAQPRPQRPLMLYVVRHIFSGPHEIWEARRVFGGFPIDERHMHDTAHMKPFLTCLRQTAGSAAALKIVYLHSNEVILQIAINISWNSGKGSCRRSALLCWGRQVKFSKRCYSTHGHQNETREIHSP